MRVIPIGGCGEFGRNMTAYVAFETMLLIDCGIQMPDDTTPGLDHLIPDFAPLFERFGPPAALFLTHGHEDHIGAVGYLLRAVGAPMPVYGRPLTLRLCERRLDRLGIPSKLRDLRELSPGVAVAIGPEATPRFSVTPLAMPHSIPEACALLVESAATPPRRVLHTGDYKLDELGQFDCSTAVDMVVGDSTNAGVPGRTGSERDVGVALAELLADPTRRGRIAVALFSSHIERINGFAVACQAAGRKLCLLGRGLHDAVAAAERAGVLAIPDNILCSAETAAALPPEQVALLCTGSQGERVAALGRLVTALDPSERAAFGGVRLSAGDTVVLSARVIPGHERPVGRLIDKLLLADVDVLIGDPYSVSGHGSQDDLRELIRAARPRALLPVHGTQRQLRAHAALAEAMGTQALRCVDGDIIEIGETISVGERLAAGVVCVDGDTVGAVSQETLHSRLRIGQTGVVAVAADPQTPGGFLVQAIGVADAGPALDALCIEAAESAAQALRGYWRQSGGQNGADSPNSAGLSLAEQRIVKSAVRSSFARRRGVKPSVLTVLAGREVGYDEADDVSAESSL